MDVSGRRALLVVNAQSRRGKEADPYVAALEAGGLTLVRRVCQRRDRLEEVILSARNEVDCVVLAGGDGTLSTAAIALRDTRLPLGILPLGAGNELARTLGVPLDAEGAAGVILAGVTRQIDLCSVNGRPFFNVASVGLTIEVGRRLHQATQARMGRLAYMGAALRVSLSHRRFSAIIRCGATIHRVRTMQVTIGNGRFYGGGMAAGARSDERMLDIYSLEPKSRWGLLFMARAFTAGQDELLPDVRMARSPVVEVVTRLPQEISADGEVVTVTPARFSVLTEAVTVYAPAAGAAGG